MNEKSNRSNSEQEIYDLILIGGGASATFLCLSILKINPEFKILILEKSATFPQKIGESVIDMTALFIASLGIEHLLEKHVQKTGVRFLFNESNSADRSKIAEFASPTFPGLIKGYHLNRSVFDEQMLDEVKSKGVSVVRPATIVTASFSDFNNELEVEGDGKTIRVKSKWLVDASGRARYIANTLNWNDQKIELNTGSIMAHFKNIAPAELWDTPKNEHWDTCSIGLRKFSTTHLMRKNSWWWIIRLDDVNTSIGVVFDKNKVQFDTYESYFIALLETDAQLSIITKNAERGPIRHIESVPYVSEKLYSKGIALIGDSGAFLDPLISPGLELIGQQSIWLADLFTQEKQTGIFKESAWKKYNNTFLKAYASRLRIYSVGYNFIQSYDLFTAWLMQGNYVYFSGLVFPSIVFKRKLKNPLRFNLLERIALNFFTWRYTKFQASRESQGRISKTAPNTLRYSDVRVPKNFRFYFVPFHLLLKSLKAYLKLEVKEIKKA